MLNRLTFGFLFTSLCSVAVASGEDWPTYKKDYSRVGYTAESLSQNLVQQWVRSSAAPPEWAWPGPGGKVVEGLKLEHRVRFDDVFHVAVVENKVFYGSSVDNSIYCVNSDSGKEIWRFFTSGPVRLAPTVVDGRVYVGSDDGFVYCLEAKNGKQIWTLRAGPRDERILARGRMASRWPVRTGVLVDDGVAYFGAGVFPHETVYIYAVNAETGAINWKNDTISQRDAGRDDLTPQGYLLATDELLFVPSGRTLPAAFRRSNGQLLHKQKGGGKQVGGAEAILDDDDILAVGGEHQILAIDQDVGSIDNRLRGRRITLHNEMAYIADGKQVFAVDRTRYAQVKEKRLELEAKLTGVERKLRLNKATVRLQRVRETQAKLESLQGDETNGVALVSQTAQLLVSASKAYETSRQQHVEFTQAAKTLREEIDALTGNTVEWRTDVRHDSSMILAGNTLVVGGASEVVLLDSHTGRARQTLEVEAEARGLAYARERLYVSTTAGKVYCFGGSNPTHNIVDAPRGGTPYPEDELSELYSSAAQQIIERSGVTRGYCLVVGSQQGRLAYELAKRTQLKVYGVDSEIENVSKSREVLAATGLYGHRITVDHVDLASYPHPRYFANLIVSDALLVTGDIPGDPVQISRHLKPEGGVICFGVPDSANEDVRLRTLTSVPQWLADTQLVEPAAEHAVTDGWGLLTRKALPGSAGWTHQYGNPGNTSTVQDDRIRGGIQVLWYGDPGPSTMLNRHEGAVGPVSAAGRLFVQGDKSVMAYDAFNGQFLWEQYNPKALRTGVFNNYEPGNLVASDESLFVVVEDKCLHLDASSGRPIRTYEIPAKNSDGTHQWGYVAYADGRLYGTCTERKMIAAEARRRGRAAEADNTDVVFAFDTTTGALLWEYQGQSISHTTIAIDGDHLYFVDSSLADEQRQQLLRQDKSALAKLQGDARELAEDRLKRMDARRAVAVDVTNGNVIWNQLVDVTDCTGVGIGAGRLTVMASGGYVVLCGANANGHYWRQFLAGEFKRRRLVVLSAATGDKIWSRDANYRHRPIIVGKRLVAEPWAYALDSGTQLMRTHPLTGKQSPWKFIRPGHHCGAISATPNLMFFRSGFTAYYDFQTDSGTNHFAGHRLGCWINTIPANGLVMIPEASAGCACLFSLTSTIVFEPRANRSAWSVYTAHGPAKPVQHMALNLGAPGDRRDAYGKLWLGYPRPSSRAGLDLPLDIGPLSPFGLSGSYFQHNSESYSVTNTKTPWLFSSGMFGITRCELPLIERGQSAASYRVRLYFAAHEDDQPGQRVFNIRLQGRTVAESVDVRQQAGASRKAVELEFDNVLVSERLAIELVPVGNSSDRSVPSLCAIEVLRSGENEILQKVASD